MTNEEFAKKLLEMDEKAERQQGCYKLGYTAAVEEMRKTAQTKENGGEGNMTEADLMRIKHKNTKLVRENVKLRKEREKLQQENDELREKLDEAKLGFIWHAMLLHVGDLIDENEQLKNRVHNLTLYLKDALLTLDTSTINHDDENHWYNAFVSTYDGLPGFNPEKMEEHDGTD